MTSILAALIIIYAAVILLLPADADVASRFGLGSLQLTLLKLTVVVPIALIWSAAFYGAVQLNNYADTVGKAKEGVAYKQIARGLQILAIGSPAISVTSNLLRYWASRNPSALTNSQIMTHYLQLAVAAAAFYFIYRGTELLKRYTKKEPNTWVYILVAVTLAVLTAIFCMITLARTGENVLVSSGQSVYYLPDWLIVASIILPYAYIWHWGAKAATFVLFYRVKVAGLIYRNALNLLASGIGVVVLSSIATQYFTALGAISRLPLQSLLVVIYLLLTLMAVGYLLIAAGSKRLQKIEEV